MKQCKCCDVELVVGENITSSQFKNSSYICKECRKEYSKTWRQNNPEYFKNQYQNNPEKFKEYQKKLNKSNPEKVKQRNKNWKQNNPEKAKESVKKCNSKIPPAIYWIWEQHKDRSELIYIGESGEPNNRKGDHFSKYKNPETALTISNVSYALSIGEIKRKNLYFNVFHFEDDKDIRKEIEARYIADFTPRYNKQSNS